MIWPSSVLVLVKKRLTAWLAEKSLAGVVMMWLAGSMFQPVGRLVLERARQIFSSLSASLSSAMVTVKVLLAVVEVKLRVVVERVMSAATAASPVAAVVERAVVVQAPEGLVV